MVEQHLIILFVINSLNLILADQHNEFQINI
jgi:hypothetical protein